MTDDLVPRLREMGEHPCRADFPIGADLREAADRIEALEEDIERLREALKRIQHFSPAHMWRAPDIKVIISAALQEQNNDQRAPTPINRATDQRPSSRMAGRI